MDKTDAKLGLLLGAGLLVCLVGWYYCHEKLTECRKSVQ